MLISISPDLARYEARDHNRWTCPIATSIEKKLGPPLSVCVTETHIRILRNGLNMYMMETDNKMFEWIRKYDMGLIVPTDIVFKLDIPEEYFNG